MGTLRNTLVFSGQPLLLPGYSRTEATDNAASGPATFLTEQQEERVDVPFTIDLEEDLAAPSPSFEMPAKEIDRTACSSRSVDDSTQGPLRYVTYSMQSSCMQ
jgi:hypothetical protein